MKSERRHALETNSLAATLARLPIFFHQYGSRILLALVLIILVIVFFVNRAATNRAAAQAAVDNLAITRELIDALRSYLPHRAGQPEQKRDAFRTIVSDADRALTAIGQGTSDPAVLAEALVARGDLNWVMANYPALTEATTRPAELTLVEDPDRLIQEAQQAYTDVLQAYPEQAMATLSARLGLAVIAENGEDWTTAEQHYNAVINDERYAAAFREEARRRLDALATLRLPVLLAERTPATQPTLPSMQVVPPPTTAPTAAPTTAPVTQPTVATTAPTTAPTAAPTTTPATQPTE